MSNKKFLKVVITDGKFDSFEIERKELEEIANVSVYQCETEEEVINRVQDADGIIVQYAPITKRVIESLVKCKVIGRYGIGMDMIDIKVATKYGIYIVNVPDYCIEEVSDHTVALILACVRKVVSLFNNIKRGKWDFQVVVPVFRLKGSIIGLVGFGNIARRVVEKIKVFGCNILVYDPYVSSNVLDKYNVTSASFERLLCESDVISIHSSLTKETRHIFGEREFKQMKKTAYIVNTSRGQIIDEKALYRALKHKWIAGAGLDVVEKEPICITNDLLKLDNVVITPHTAFYSVTALKDLKKYTAKGVAQVLKGEEPSYLVNKEVMK